MGRLKVSPISFPDGGYRHRGRLVLERPALWRLPEPGHRTWALNYSWSEWESMYLRSVRLPRGTRFRKCVDHLISAIIGEERTGDTFPYRWKYIVERYKAQEKEAVLAMEDHFRNLSLGVASLINIFAPQKVIIGGGISESGDFYIDNIREQVGKYVMKETSYFTTIELARLGNKAGCLGAAALVFNH